MKKRLGLFIAMTLIFSTFTGAYAKKENPTPTVVSDIAAYLSGDFYGHSMTIEGSIYSQNGNVKFNGAGDNYVYGNITLNSSKSYIEENPYSKPTINGTVTKIANTTFDYSVKNLIDTPNIANTVNSFVADWYPAPGNVTVSTHYKSLSVISTLKVDTSKGDIYIVADSLTMGSNASIEIIGTGKLYLFVNNSLTVSGSSTINNNGTSNNVSIILKGNLAIDGAAKVFANLYIQNDAAKLEGSGTLYGNIYSSAKTFSTLGGGKVYGTVYVPASDAVIANSGTIYGKLIAKSLDIYGQGKISYAKAYADLVIPANLFKYTLTVDVPLAGAGSVTPNTSTFNYGDVITLSVVANDGYEFVEFTSANSGTLPDADKKITITQDTVLTAVFKKTEAPVVTPTPTPEVSPTPTPVVVPVVNDIPKGSRVWINYPYAYLYGYEQGTVGGEDDVKREEASALLYRLLKQDNQIGGFVAGPSTFTDVSDTRWSKNALMYMKYIGVYPRDYVNPHHAITRGEVAKIITFALRIQPDDTKTISFADLRADNANYWYLKALIDLGIMVGYNGEIKPNDNITRSEYITIVNRLLGRDAQYNIDDSKSIYPDLVDKSYWAYNDLMRASFGFTDNKINGFYQIDPSRKPARATIDYN